MAAHLFFYSVASGTEGCA